MSRNISIIRSLDWVTILLYLIIVSFGWICIYSVSYNFTELHQIFDFGNRAGKQFVWMLTAFFIGFMLLLIDYRFYNSSAAYVIYAIMMLLLILTIFIAPDVKGSRSWIILGPVSLQPAEFAKFATALALARTIDEFRKQYSLKKIILLGLIVFLPFASIILQKEMGTALVFSVFFLVFYREGMSGVVLLLGLFAVILFVLVVRFGEIPLLELNGDLGLVLAFSFILLVLFLVLLKNNKKEAYYVGCAVLSFLSIAYVVTFFYALNATYIFLFCIIAIAILFLLRMINAKGKVYLFLLLFTVFSVLFSFGSNSFFYSVLQPHQQTRIKIVLNMENDLSGAGYNVNQSKIAIGSGQLFGKGFLHGTQTKLKFVPEQDTDFIFCTVGEEFGFVGSSILLILYLLLFLRLIYLAERQRSVFSRVYGYSVASIFFFHVFVNVGMVLGLLPVIGIPLPFFSYGGSSLWSFTILLFIMLRLDTTRAERLN